MTPFGRFVEQSPKTTATIAVRQAFEDSGIGIGDGQLAVAGTWSRGG